MMRQRSFSRRRLVVGSLGAAGFALVGLGAAPATPAARLALQVSSHTVTSLPGVGRASAINSSGQIVGLSGSTAALWDQFQYTDLGTWSGDSSSEAIAINDAGVIVGVSWSASSQPHAVVWAQGQVFDLGTLAGGSESMAYGINGRNQVVGWSSAADGVHHAVRWELEQGQITDLGTAGGASAEATGINDDGIIAGWIEGPDGVPHAGRLDAGGTFTDLGAQSIALAINADGLIVGSIGADGGSTHAAMWNQGGVVDLDPDGSSSQALAINDGGIAVGSAVVDGLDVAVHWDTGRSEMLQLDGLVDGSTAAYSVNGSDQIVGESDGQPVLWTP